MLSLKYLCLSDRGMFENVGDIGNGGLFENVGDRGMFGNVGDKGMLKKYWRQWYV